MPKDKKSLTEDMYTYNIGFNSNNQNSYLNEKDIKNIIENPADGDLRFKITKSKTKLDDKASLVPDSTKVKHKLK